MVSIQKIRWIWMSLLALVLIWLAYEAIAPFGSIQYKSNFVDNSYFISHLTPKDRLVDGDAVSSATVKAEPVYFSIFTTRPFRKAYVHLEFERPAPLMEMGIRRGPTVWNFDRQPLYSNVLENIGRAPETIKENGVMIWQKKLQHHSVQEFLQSNPPLDTTAVYNYNMRTNVHLKDYQPYSIPRTLALGLKGHYEIVTYSGGESIEMRFNIHDLNENKDPDPIVVTLYNNKGEGIANAELADDAGMPKKMSGEKTVTLKSGPVPAGVYKIEFKSNDDIITDSLTTRQSKISFTNRLWLAASKRGAFSLYTDGSHLDAQTIAPASLQTIHSESQQLVISETYRQFRLQYSHPWREDKSITLSRDDVILASDGVFAFKPEELINASFRALPEEQLLQTAHIDSIVAGYEPVTGNNVLQRDLVFDLSGAYREKGRYSFLIAAPGVEKVADGAHLISIRVRFEGMTLWEFIKKYVQV